MKTLHQICLIGACVLLTGCAEHVDLRVTSAPAGASLYYRVGTVVTPGQPEAPRTNWKHLGPCPYERRVTVPPFWSDPGMTFELRVKAPGHGTEQRTYEPARIRTDDAHLTDHFVLDRTAPK